MSNLIVTIISIALVAVATIMGAYYGGQAFEQASINAYAATTINVMQQIKAAAYLYEAYNPDWQTTFAQSYGQVLVTDKYLTLSFNTTYNLFGG